jgi:hypothetical protein
VILGILRWRPIYQDIWQLPMSDRSLFTALIEAPGVKKPCLGHLSQCNDAYRFASSHRECRQHADPATHEESEHGEEDPAVVGIATYNVVPSVWAICFVRG